MNFKFIGVFSWDGVVSGLQFYETLEEGIEKMDKHCAESEFNQEEDNARIFPMDDLSNPVYSFNHEEYQEKTSKCLVLH